MTIIKPKILFLASLLCCAAATAFMACGNDLSMLDDMSELDDILNNGSQQQQDAIRVDRVLFSPDYKTFEVTTRMNRDIGPYALLDKSIVSVSVDETIDGIKKSRRSAPMLIDEKNLKADNIRESGASVLVLVDATLPQAALDNIRLYVNELWAVFRFDNLYVAFMQGMTVTENMKVSRYVLDNHFYHVAEDYVYLYRSILQKKHELTSLAPASSTAGLSPATKTALLVFSNEKIYEEETDEPIDPDHFLFEEEMLQNIANPVAGDSPTFTVSYASMKSWHQGEEGDMSVSGDFLSMGGETQSPTSNLLKLFCQKNHGIYMSQYDGTDFKNALLEAFHISLDANQFTFENPDGKVYRGDFETLHVTFKDRQNDSIIASFNTTIHQGNIYTPIIVHGKPVYFVILQGIVLGVFLQLLVYLLFQFLIPFIRYRLFLRKYVIRYTSGNMAVGNTVVQQACYLCKAPFKTGDEIVVKCSHTMHRACWEENEYHCPEYSDRCKHGSHYYNRQNLADRRNASFYMKWILMAIIAALMAWIVFTVTLRTSPSSAPNILNSPLISVLTENCVGLSIGFFLTLGIAILALRLRNVYHHVGNVLLRAVVAALGCYVVFLCNDVIIDIFDITLRILLEWIPWTLSGFIIAFCGTFRTRVRLRKSLLLLAVLLGFLSMYLWSALFFNFDLDFRVLLFFSFCTYSVGLALCVAMAAPRSERYFLHVQGAVKEMDIALFKWFRNSPKTVVTIGKSVDCSLQLSWDVTGDVAPVHAEIHMQRYVPYLTAREPGVYVNGKPLPLGRKIWLYHGKSFAIGNTTFTYIEKDLTQVS